MCTVRRLIIPPPTPEAEAAEQALSQPQDMPTTERQRPVPFDLV